jgi:transcriptional regulator with XRE-family HTH domain
LVRVKRQVKKSYKEPPLLSSVGAKIREARVSKGIFIEALASDCKVDYSQIARMERGEVNFSLSTLYRIARVLQVDPRSLQPPL